MPPRMLLCYDVAADALTRPRPEPGVVAVPPALLEADPDRSIGAEPRVGRDRAPDAIFVPTPQDVQGMTRLPRLQDAIRVLTASFAIGHSVLLTLDMMAPPFTIIVAGSCYLIATFFYISSRTVVD